MSEGTVSLPQQDPPPVQPSLTDQERTQLGRLLGFPLDLPPSFVTWMEGRMQLLLDSGNILGLQQRIACVGDYKVIAKDLSANNAALYVWEDAQGTWLYCNGQSFSATDYPLLNAFLGGTVLPDALGRFLGMTGTNAATNLLDNDGIALASRQPKHTHSDNISVSAGSLAVVGASAGTPAGTVAITDPGHVHSGAVNFDVTQFIEGGTASSATSTNTGSATTGITAAFTGTAMGTHGHSLSGSPSKSGSVGSGMAGSDAIAHAYVGSLLIKAD